MRIRHKPWARPELDACPFYKKNPELNRGIWREQFVRLQPLHLELGCGKGGFMAKLASQNPDINYLAVDIKSEMLALCKRNIEGEFAAAGRAVDNVLLFAHDIERLSLVLSPEDVVERIYINFCNPWPKRSYQKHRLTHTRQLTTYRTFLQPGGEIWFKTDDRELFMDSKGYFAESGFSIRFCTEDLHRAGIEGNIETEHERMFSEEGKPIYFLIARCEQSEQREENE